MSRIKELREKSGFSQSQFAKEINITTRRLQSYEQKQRDFSRASIEVILKICTALNCTLEEMFSDEPDVVEAIKKYEYESNINN